MDGALVGRRGERQADGLVAGSEPLVLLGDKHPSKERSDKEFGFSSFRR